MFDLVSRTNRRDDVSYTRREIIASYTLDSNYVASYEIYYGDTEVWRKVQPLGSVLALNPATRKVVPNFASYDFGAVGVLLDDAMVEYGDKEVNVLYKGVANEKAVWDDGQYQNVLQATRDDLADRITFINADKVDDLW
jgi:hypothetical protein